MRRDQDQPKNSFEAAFRAYQRANPSLRTPIGREIAPGTTTPVRTDHTAIVLNQEMIWDLTPRLFSPL